MKSKFGSGEKRQYQNLLNKDQQFKRTKKKDQVKDEEKSGNKDEKDTSKEDKSNDVVEKLEDAVE